MKPTFLMGVGKPFTRQESQQSSLNKPGLLPKRSLSRAERQKSRQHLAKELLPQGRGGKFRRIWVQLALTIVSVLSLVVIIVLVQISNSAVASSKDNSRLAGILWVDACTTLAVLRTAQGVLAAITSMVIGDAFECLQWMLVASRDGLPFLSLLALSSGTGPMGLARLVAAKCPVEKLTRFWAALR